VRRADSNEVIRNARADRRPAHPTPVGRLTTERNGGSLNSGTVALREPNMHPGLQPA
jgi:hypothetical protein